MFIFESVSGKGGVGKTTLAWALACYWANQGAKVAMVDKDDTSYQLTDMFNEFDNPGFTLLDAVPDESDNYDICIVDRSPTTKADRNDYTAVLYIFEPHRLAIQAYDRARRMIAGRNAVLVVNKCNFANAKHKSNARSLELEHGCIVAKINVTFEKMMEDGLNFYSMQKNNTWYKARKILTEIAQELEEHM